MIQPCRNCYLGSIIGWVTAANEDFSRSKSLHHWLNQQAGFYSDILDIFTVQLSDWHSSSSNSLRLSFRIRYIQMTRWWYAEISFTKCHTVCIRHFSLYIGCVRMLQNEKKQWELQVDHSLFAIDKLDVTVRVEMPDFDVAVCIVATCKGMILHRCLLLIFRVMERMKLLCVLGMAWRIS